MSMFSMFSKFIHKLELKEEEEKKMFEEFVMEG